MLAIWAGAMRVAHRAVTTRRILAEMDGRLLADIGLSRGEALREARRRPWDLAPPPADAARRRHPF